MWSFKQEFIRHCQMLPKIEGFENNKLVIVTAAGVFSGIPKFQADDGDDAFVQAMFAFIDGVSDDYRKEHCIPADKPLGFDNECIVLTDVTLLSGVSHTTIPNVTIFFDQIIGISFCN